MISVVICDDQTVVREGLSAILSTSEEIQVVDEAANGEEAIEKALEKKPQVMLMDLNMPVMNGVQAIRQIKTKMPDIRCLVLTTYADDEWMYDALEAGADGYVLKDTRRDELIQSIIGTAGGKTYIDPNIAGKLVHHIVNNKNGLKSETPRDDYGLNDRELEIVGYITKGMSNQDIADQMYLAYGTVRNYVSDIFAKLNVKTRAEAAIFAERAKLIKREP